MFPKTHMVDDVHFLSEQATIVEAFIPGWGSGKGIEVLVSYAAKTALRRSRVLISKSG